MNKPPLATNMHLCCRDANHKHLYLLASAGTKSGDARGGEQKKRGGREGGREETGGGGEIVPRLNLLMKG